MTWIFAQMLNFLLIVEHKPALGAENLPVGFGFDVLDLKYEVFPLFAILFNHFLFNLLLSTLLVIFFFS